MTRFHPVPLTAQHLREGEPFSCAFCPVALALREATGQPWWIYGRLAVCLADDVPRPAWPLPPRVQAWIAAFDAGLPVHPHWLRLPARFPVLAPASTAKAPR